MKIDVDREVLERKKLCFYNFFGWIINENYSLSTQLLTLFSTLTIISGGITLGICLGMLYAVGESAYTSSETIILDNTKSNARNLGDEIVDSINQRLSTISQSVCQMSSQYGKTLLQSPAGNSYEPILQPTLSFREYNFYDGCSYPACPKDFGPIATRSRIPYLPGFVDGSLDHSSVYFYSTDNGRAYRDDSSWDAAFAANPYLNLVYDGLAFQDADLNILYNQGPNSTVMFYLSAQVFPSSFSTDYFSLHRTYPGIMKNDSSYNPPLRSWFKNAPIDKTFVYGPYRETFTRKKVVTLSTKSQTTIQGGYVTNVVAAAVVLIDDLKQIINDLDYANDGFGVLLTTSKQVLVWGNQTDVYNYQTSQFKTLADFDPKLDPHISNDPSKSAYVVEYSDSAGRDWYVTAKSFFPSGTSDKNAFIMLVFSSKAKAEKPLHSLQHNIDDTTASISTKTIIIVCLTIGGVMLFVGFLLWYITVPLNNMMHISSDLIKLSAEDEETRDYTNVLSQAYNNMSRNDEVGILASDYYHVICMLQNKVMKKRAVVEYPPNPFYIADVNVLPTLDWSLFYRIMFTPAARMAPEPAAIPTDIIPNVTAVEIFSTTSDCSRNLDVLASIGQRYAPVSAFNDVQFRENGSSTDIELGNRHNNVDPNGNINYATIIGDEIELIEISPSRDVSIFASLASQLYFLVLILLAGLVLAMVLTVVSLHDEGASWMNESGDELIDVQVLNLQEIAQTKSKFVESYFEQLNLDLLSAGNVLTELLDHQLNRPDYLTNGYYFSSYSIDASNPYAAGVTTSTSFSGYYSRVDVGCPGSNCYNTHNSMETKLTSLYDLKLKSYFYANNSVSFYQFALTDGFTRYFPYTKSTANSNPTSCLTMDYPGTCHNLYMNSLCAGNGGSYAPYDPHCRSWYNLGSNPANDPTKVIFQYPRVSSSGKFVLTAVLPIYQNQSQSKTFYGVLNSNFLVSTLSNAINSLTILNSGYSYVIDSKNITSIVLYPNLQQGCMFIECAERFSNDNEYQNFKSNVLSVIQSNPQQSHEMKYTKRGKTWRLVTHPIHYGTIDYTLMVTVPNDEVLEASIKTQDSINKTVVGMIVAFVFAIVIFMIIFYYFTRSLVRSIILPIDDLRQLFNRILTEDYSVTIPTKASSYDLKILLKALSNLLIALRFGSDNFARGNVSAAESLFLDALRLFSLLSNIRGIGACYNNLAMIELSRNNFIKAKEYMDLSIANAKELLEQLNSAASSPATADEDDANAIKNRLNEKTKLQKLLSDRQGNLVLIYLEQGNFQDAFALLESLLEEDKKNYYIRGCVIKQGILGQYYLKQNEISSAEKIFQSALQFIEQGHMERAALTAAQEEGQEGGEGKRDEDTKNIWRLEEVDLAEQIALYNLVLLLEAKNKTILPSNSTSSKSKPKASLQGRERERNQILDEIIHRYLIALTKVRHMHTNTVKNILVSLKLKYFHQFAHLSAYENELDQLAERYDFQLMNTQKDKNGNSQHGSSRHGGNNGITKRVAFAIDYSGSMSGTKIRSAVENLKMVFEKYIYSNDFISIITFSHIVSTILPLTQKVGNEDMIRNRIDLLTAPSGSTALYDAIDHSLQALQQSASSSSAGSDWIVLLTDGKDTASNVSVDQLRLRLSMTDSIGLIIIGVGADVDSALLRRIVTSCKQSPGHYVSASGDKKSINQAFGQVAQIISSQMFLEDI